MIVFIIVVGYGNRHRWYQLPLVPIAAAFAGVACAFVGSKISSRVIAVTLSVLTREFVHNPRVLVHSTVLPIICRNFAMPVWN